MLTNTQNRSKEREIMDDFDMEGEALEEALGKIAWINRILGGNKLTLNAVKKILQHTDKSKPVRITDLGCGNGDMLRALHRMGKKHKMNLLLKGTDANKHTVRVAGKLSLPYPGITYECSNMLDDDFEMEACDIALLTLTLHHFHDEEIVALLKKIMPKVRTAIIVNDLQRSKIAYYLFSGISRIFRLGTMNTNDGKLSILRGFKRKELETLARSLHLKQYSLHWKWAFRYRWIIDTL